MKKYLVAVLLSLVLTPFIVEAQEVVAPVPVPAAESPAAPAATVPAIDLNAPFTQSFLFSPAEVVALRRAASGQVTGTAVLNAGSVTQVPVRRIISLAGVVYRSDHDWIVWINGKKMTPKDILPEIVDIRVANDRVHLKWFDIGLNNVISITLRPHQTYDIVTGILLPG